MSSATNMGAMFGRATSFNQPLLDWDVSNVVYTDNMFLNTAFNHPLDGWNVNRMNNMQSMFQGAVSS